MASSNLNAPNLISGLRLILSFVFFGFLSFTDWWITATVLFVVAVATDALDGYLARKYQQITVLGRILDPLVDKVIICGAFVFLQALPGSGVTPWITLIIVLRELYVTSLRGFFEQQGVDFYASSIGKWKMVDQCIAVVLCLLSLDAGWAAVPYFLQIRDVFLVVAVLITIYSGYDYTKRGIVLYRERQSTPAPEAPSSEI